jgi:O-succinylbenzoic acid--CoA ligase
MPTGEYGEVIVSGPTVMHGYLDQPPTLGTIRTGDIGYFDADGDLWIVQRRSDLIVSGGENIYPAEVEAVLRTYPDVMEVCVVGLPSEEWGQQVAAAIVPRAGSSPNAEALIAYARTRLAGYKVPRLIRFLDSLPQTSNGKVHRQSVIARLS